MDEQGGEGGEGEEVGGGAHGWAFLAETTPGYSSEPREPIQFSAILLFFDVRSSLDRILRIDH